MARLIAAIKPAGRRSRLRAIELDDGQTILLSARPSMRPAWKPAMRSKKPLWESWSSEREGLESACPNHSAVSLNVPAARRR